jgi:catechol 2,3-dioxygenase-like lactoylglutathione lyase family enzyme
LTPPVCQVAFTHLGGCRLWEWYRDGFHFLPSGSTLFLGPPASKVNGLPWPAFPGRWLLDAQGRFQLEFFRFLRPRSKARRPDERPSDLGYRMVGIHTEEFDATRGRLERLGSAPVAGVLGGPGDRRACFRDPEGNLVEVLERDPLEGNAPPKERPDVPATVRFVTLSVADLPAAREAWVEKIGMGVAPVPALHRPEHEALWGLPGAERKSAVLLGGGVLVELVEYQSPRGRPLPDGYRICDQGLMNIAFGARDREEFDRVFARWAANGLRPTSPTPLEIGVFRVMYFTTPAGESVELLYPRRWAWSLTGFRPRGRYVAEETFVESPPEATWEEVIPPEQRDFGTPGRLRVLGMTFDARVLHRAAPTRFAFEVERGVFRSHRGDVALLAERGGTRVRWAIRLRRAIPGIAALVALLVRRRVRRALRRLRARLAPPSNAR